MGYKSGTPKINMLIAREIRDDRNRGSSLKDLSSKYELSQACISNVINHKTWRDDG